MKKSFFGKFNSILDESVHVFLSFLVAGIGYYIGLSAYYSLVIFLAGSFLVDIDHLFNTFICRDILKIQDYKGSIKHGDKGYAPNIFHGIDVAILISALCLQIDLLFGIFLFINLSLHLLWDFMVYPNRAYFLFFTSRAFNKFKVGPRDYFVGKIFDLDTLHW